MKLYQLPFYGFFYRTIMKAAHHFNWHYAPPIYPENDIQLWCKWCGFRQTIKRGDAPSLMVLPDDITDPQPEE